ncbi:MAG: hypothetical protein OEZ58_16645, partial [Gammaproteobacteria bacterium]|nr:hypothetical protein [Gammaproteobacteria bacterium]
MDSLYQKLKFLVLILSITTVGSACSVGPNIVQIDKPIELVSGAPKNECEQKFFLQAVPSKIVTKARQSSSKTAGNELVTIVKTLETTSQGLALYQYGQAKALKLPEVLPKLENEALTNTHMKRIQPYLDRRNQINKVALRSLAIQSIGIA